jgi:hypothetical protein
MITLIQADLIPIAASFLIGLVTARWAFRRTAAKPTRGPEPQ